MKETEKCCAFFFSTIIAFIKMQSQNRHKSSLTKENKYIFKLKEKNAINIKFYSVLLFFCKLVCWIGKRYFLFFKSKKKYDSSIYKLITGKPDSQ
jgi:hypothetical protein